ncbi:hypothetical protein B5M47_03025 [candidate division CPR3 bacterium 4484_211]|uniref:Histone deacetylase domain-containing protein n=1 Tax=candidate division CPR3 bacterium 4484_211 TaxID=1968527 RepID=A0A1W9NXJ7_UNCC3|nr:MAG: hypothetical protein B5M47_03025 [candidate division CPR3 bacterium 4484_211]
MHHITFIWTDEYLKYNFGPTHPFRSERGKVFLDKLSTQTVPFEYKISSPKKATDEDILLVHTLEYLKGVKRLYQEHKHLALDTPLPEGILEAAYYYVGGTILASQLALKGELTMNLLGGLHHAQTNHGGGFCIFNDHAIAIRKLRKQRSITKAMILDLDVHAGNGTQEIFYSDPTVLTISLHQDPNTLYPGTGFKEQIGEGPGKGFNINYPLPPGTKGQKYLKILDKALKHSSQFNPDITYIILGVDTYKEDPLASLRLEEEDYQKIGLRLSDLCSRPLVILCAGGYSPKVPDLWLKFLKGLTHP